MLLKRNLAFASPAKHSSETVSQASCCWTSLQPHIWILLCNRLAKYIG